jgi:hypothetical protein
MPEVQLCMYCKKKIDPRNEEYVLVRNSDGANPQALAHVPCRQAN